jgi:hypothetical protein
MKIQVVFDNGRKAWVTGDMLDYLLKYGGIVSFKRHDGWVRLGCDSVRVRETRFFSIPERRLAMNALIESDSLFTQR